MIIGEWLQIGRRYDILANQLKAIGNIGFIRGDLIIQKWESVVGKTFDVSNDAI